ncbi:MAG: DUF4384 domain-containing protein [Thermoplasmata archaeon]|nr:DUF4384 domain-containing protein [Thermoplasmata archaeon]
MTAPAVGDDGKGRIQVWTDNGTTPYRAGDHARVFMRGEDDAYVTVFRVDTDGRIRVLFPRAPWMDNYVRGGHEYEIEPARDANAFDVDDDPGVGYVFAVWSPDPFTFGPIVDDSHWDYRAIGDGRIHGDPYVALTDLAGRILPDGDDNWDYDISPYYVERHYEYPRFLCYDCHAFASFGAWDPYAATCPRFRIVAYDDPIYYPYRYYEGRTVVVNRPLRPEPRFVFKDRGGVSDDQFVTVTRDRSREGGARGATGRDFGGSGRVPAPDRGGAPRRRRAAEPPHQSPAPPPPRPQPKPSAEPRRAPQPAAKSPPPKEPAKGQPELRRRKP